MGPLQVNDMFTSFPKFEAVFFQENGPLYFPSKGTGYHLKAFWMYTLTENSKEMPILPSCKSIPCRHDPESNFMLLIYLVLGQNCGIGSALIFLGDYLTFLKRFQRPLSVTKNSHDRICKNRSTPKLHR